MLFYRERDGMYYFFNEEHPICVMPAFQGEAWLSNTLSQDVREMHNYLNRPRVKLMVIRKTRYIIEQRGKFVAY